MKRTLFTAGLLAVLATTAAPAQTRVSVSIVIGAPAPYVVHHRRPSRWRYDVHPPLVVVVERPTFRRVPRWIVRPRPVVVLRHHPRRHHRRW